MATITQPTPLGSNHRISQMSSPSLPNRPKQSRGRSREAVEIDQTSTSSGRGAGRPPVNETRYSMQFARRLSQGTSRPEAGTGLFGRFAENLRQVRLPRRPSCRISPSQDLFSPRVRRERSFTKAHPSYIVMPWCASITGQLKNTTLERSGRKPFSSKARGGASI